MATTPTHSRPPSCWRYAPVLGLAVASCLAGFLTGCGRESIAVYEAPKESPPPPPPAANPHGAMGGGMMDQAPPRPGIRWSSLPEGWTSRGASGMRAANFTLSGEGTASADLAVIPLPGTGGSDVELVNLWRGQLGLPPIAEDALPAHSDSVEIAGLPTVRLFSIVGSESSDAAAAANQILVATIRRDGFTWFFKLSGDAPTVASHRERLKAFLGTIEFTAPESPAPTMAAAAPMASPPAASAAEGGSDARWSVPAGWTSVPAPQMVHSKWTVSTADGATASITVSVFPGATGGPVMNLNRWRSQVGLPPAPEAEITALLDNTDVLGGKATLADFTGTSPESGDPARLVAAIVQRSGQSWFYKLLGAPAAVEAEREAFVRFVQTVQY